MRISVNFQEREPVKVQNYFLASMIYQVLSVRPEYAHFCTLDDPDFSECIRHNLMVWGFDVFKQMREGILYEHVSIYR